MAVAGGAGAAGLAVAGAAGLAGALGAGFWVDAGGLVVVCASSGHAPRRRTEPAETTTRETRRAVGYMSFISREQGLGAIAYAA